MAHAGCVGHFIVVVVDCVCMTLKSKSLLVIMMISKKRSKNIRVDWMCISHSYAVCVNRMVFAKRP